jgi:hypothetical protein
MCPSHAERKSGKIWKFLKFCVDSEREKKNFASTLFRLFLHFFHSGVSKLVDKNQEKSEKIQ